MSDPSAKQRRFVYSPADAGRVGRGRARCRWSACCSCCAGPPSTCTGSTTRRTSGWCSRRQPSVPCSPTRTGSAAERRGDARVLLVSLAFLSAAGFLGLHALATPGVLLATPNAGFVVATPVGYRARVGHWRRCSSLDLAGERAVRAVALVAQWLRLGLLALMAAVGRLLAGPAPAAARRPVVPEQAEASAGAASRCPAIALYAVAAVRYGSSGGGAARRCSSSMLAAFVLLAEAMVAIVFARNWQLSWWEWHVLMLAAFALVAAGAQAAVARGALRRPLPRRTPSPGAGRSACSSPTCRGSRRSRSGTHRPR